MSFSEISICNMALEHIKEDPIADINSKGEIETRCKRNYPIARDIVTARFAWTCAVTRVLLPKLSDAPAFGWLYQYELPADCLRVLPLTEDGSRHGAPVAYETESGRILTDASAPLKIRYIRKMDNASQIDENLADAISYFLAGRLAKSITGKESLRDKMTQMYQLSVREAKAVDSQRGPADDVIPREDA